MGSKKNYAKLAEPTKIEEAVVVQPKAQPNDPFANGFGPYVKKSLHELLFTSQLNWLLLCTPFAFLCVALDFSGPRPPPPPAIRQSTNH